MNATTLRLIAAPTLVAAGGAAAIFGGIDSKREGARIAAETRAGGAPDLVPMYRTFSMAGVGIAAAGAGILLATQGAKSGLPALVKSIGFASGITGTALGGGVALVGLVAYAMDRASHAAPHAPGTPGLGV
jgi:hypothetical protein